MPLATLRWLFRPDLLFDRILWGNKSLGLQLTLIPRQAFPCAFASKDGSSTKATSEKSFMRIWFPNLFQREQSNIGLFEKKLGWSGQGTAPCNGACNARCQGITRGRDGGQLAPVSEGIDLLCCWLVGRAHCCLSKWYVALHLCSSF